MKSLARAWFGTLLFLAGGCQTHDTPARTSSAAATLNVGFGSLGGTAELGLRQVVRNQAIEPLVKYDETGRPIPFLAERWTLSDDGLKLTIQLKPVVFHDGSPLTASDAVQSLQSSLPRIAGPLYDDVAGIEAVSDRELAISFKRRTTFAIEVGASGIAVDGALVDRRRS